MTHLIEKTILISAEYHGQRIDVVLARLFPEYSRSQLSHWLKQGLITLNQDHKRPKDKVFVGDRLDINVAVHDDNDAACGPEAISLNIVYEDDDVLVINKPAGLVVHPGAGNREHTLVNALLHHAIELKHLPRAGIVHRLDKDTTGLLVIAKTLTAHAYLIKAMQARDIHRHYICLVNGSIISGGDIQTGYGRHPKNRLKMAVVPHGREAITHYSVRKHYPRYTLLDVKLSTGRTHQIRVHMAHINHPVVGDPLYGQKKISVSMSDEAKHLIQRFNRQALHASKLSFLHPRTKEQLTFEIPLPDDFKCLLETLDCYVDTP